MSLPLIPTALVGSYVQPDWAPPRVRAAELWRLSEEHLEEAQDAATLVATREMERAGPGDTPSPPSTARSRAPPVAA